MIGWKEAGSAHVRHYHHPFCVNRMPAHPPRVVGGEMSLKIKMHAMYDHFPDLNPKEGETFIDCYSDSHVFECRSRGKNIALLLEPRSMLGDADRYVEEHADYFRYIFTHDSKLLSLPQARELNWGDVWLTTNSPKTKGISICTSYKNWCTLHKTRLELAEYYKDRPEVDVFCGDWNNPNIPVVEAKDYLEHYKYSIIVENDIDDYWYTEKILNCFATKTVPIYIGARKIGERFNEGGIIKAQLFRDVLDIVATLDINADYESRKAAIEDNFERVKPYNVKWKERFFRNYRGLLEELQNE